MHFNSLGQSSFVEPSLNYQGVMQLKREPRPLMTKKLLKKIQKQLKKQNQAKAVMNARYGR